jgi:hypothetical protein
MSDAKLRAWWSHRQGLDGRLSGKPPAEVLSETGWARSVGGANPYLTLFARAGTRRETADSSVAKLEIHELPSARGCTYVVPSSDFALALTVAQDFGGGDMNTARKLGVTDKEIDKLRDAVVSALSKGPLDPEELRDATGGASRNLGPEGKKKGVTTTLPLALGKLQTEGEIRRLPMNGRLDQQRYRYTLWRPNPLKKSKRSPAEVYTELARRYFRWIGPATLAEFQWFSGLGVKAAKEAIAPLKLSAHSGERMMLPVDREEFEKFKVPSKPQFVLTGSIDGMLLLRRDVKGLLEPEDFDRKIFSERGFMPAGGVMDLPSHAILDRGRIVGVWEYDPGTDSIAWMSFIGENRALKEAVQRAEEYVRTDLGDARSFSLDSPKSRVPKIEALRKGVA